MSGASSTRVNIYTLFFHRSDRARWMEAVTPVKVSDDHERIYEEWGKKHSEQNFLLYTRTSAVLLTLATLWADSADNNLVIFSYFS